MKNKILSLFISSLFISSLNAQDLILTAVYDGPLSGGTPKGVELYVISDIADLSKYALGSANNGDGSDGAEYTLSGSASAGDYLYIASESTQFTNFFGFAPTATSGHMGINGDDAIELFYDADDGNGMQVIDVFGDINTDGTGQAWDHLDGWAYRKSFTNKSNNSTWTIGNWNFSGTNELEGGVTNATVSTPMPIGNYDFSALNTVITGDAGWRLLSLPITNGDVSDVSDDSPVQGITGGSDASREANFYIYDDSGAWEEPSNATTAWGDGYGFAMYFFDNTNNGSSALPVTLDVSGSEPSSNVTVNLYGGAANRYTLVGNPFASNLNTNSITVTGGSIQNNISFWNDAGSTYSAQDRTGSYTIAPWQGFFVETSDASASSITIPTSAKTTSATSGTFFSKVADIRGDINFALTSETTNDEAIRLSFRANATPDWDLDDASKLTPLLSAYATLGFATNDMVKSVESLPYRLEEEVTLPMQLDLVGVEGEFSLGWDGLETIPDEWELILHDYEQGTSVNLRDIDEYTFEAEPEVASKRNPLTVLSMPAKSMAKASQDERFGLTVRPVSVGNEEELSPYSFTLDQNYPNPFNPKTNITYSLERVGLVSLSVYNALGQQVTQLVNKSQSPGRYNVQWDASVAPTGIYYYRLEVGNVSITKKMTLIK